jgi:hypothetical protein
MACQLLIPQMNIADTSRERSLMRKFLVLLGLVAILQVSAYADSVTISWVTGNPVTIKFKNNNYSGVIQGPISTAADKFIIDGVDAYCVDLSHYIFTNPTNVSATTAPLSTWGTNGNPSPGYPDYTGAGHAAAWLYNTYVSQGTSATNFGALQLAIWEALYESPATGSSIPTFNVNNGNIFFTGSNAILTQANIYLSSLQTELIQNPASVMNADASWIQTSNTGGVGSGIQDYVKDPPVPEPSTLVLGGTGLLFFAVCGWRRRRKE